MLAVVLAAGLFPNAGTVSAQTSSCPYGGCSSSSSIPAWEYVTILVLVAAGVILAVLFLMRRRRPPPAAAVPPGPSAEGAPAGAAPTAPAGPVPPYVETPEDVGHAPPSAGAAGAAAPPAWAEPGTDIDSLMAELDRISSDILKKAPKKGATAKGAEKPEEPEEPKESEGDENSS